MSEEENEQILASKARGGDKEAYRRLVEKYEKRVFAIAFQIVRSKEDAEDIMQESFVKAYMSLKDFKGESSFYTWLYRIVYNMSLDFKRKISRRGTQPTEFDESKLSSGSIGEGIVSGSVRGPHEEYLSREQAGLIQKVLNELSDDHRIVITLREIDGLSYDEIARIVGVSKGTVMSRLHYARKRLQSALKEYAPPDVADIDDDKVISSGKRERVGGAQGMPRESAIEQEIKTVSDGFCRTECL